MRFNLIAAAILFGCSIAALFIPNYVIAATSAFQGACFIQIYRINRRNARHQGERK